jgi:tetratricopeptide (TPR) repeat protein
MGNKRVQGKTGKTAETVKQAITKEPEHNGKYLWMPLLGMALALIVYLPVFKAGFVNWDDDDYVVKNYAITSFKNINDILTKPVQGNYHPLTMLSLAFNYAVSGEDARSYHIVNLLLHLLNVLLVFLFVRRLTGNKPWLAFVTAMLFAVHPLHAESVAWVSERKDVLYSFFFLAGLHMYIRYSQNRKITDYLIVTGLFILSLLSKPAAVIFPLVLLAIDYYFGKLRSARNWLEKIPFLALSVGMGILTLVAQKHQGAVSDAVIFPLMSRFFFGFYGIMMYLVKSILPINLCTFYPFPAVNEPLPIAYYISPLVGAALLAILIFTFRKNKLISFAILFYLVNLALVLQFLPVGSAVIADRYAYLPVIGVFMVPAFFFQKAADKNQGKPTALWVGLLVVIALILSVLTYRQAMTWQSSASLWDRAIKIAPSSRAYTNRGLLFKQEKNYDQALEMYNKAIAMNKVEKEALINRGNIYFDRQDFERAISDYNACLAIDSTMQKAIENRGSAYGALGKYDLAVVDLNKALELDPNSQNGYANRGVFYQNTGQNDKAIADFYKQMEVNHKESADLLNSIAVSYIRQNIFDKALDVLTKAINLEEKGIFYMNRSMVFSQLGRKAEAKDDALKAQSMGVKVEQGYLDLLGR